MIDTKAVLSPETLRELIHGPARDGVRKLVLNHANAWEKDREHIDVLERAMAEAMINIGVPQRWYTVSITRAYRVLRDALRAVGKD